MNKLEKDKFFEHFDALLLSIDYPDYKYENTRVLFRRLIGRAMPSKWEFAVLMGIISKAREYSEVSPMRKREDQESGDQSIKGSE
jgi:tRNA C32,U32 (ribose-2'-O)-methylase TrmJ